MDKLTEFLYQAVFWLEWKTWNDLELEMSTAYEYTDR